MESSNTMKVMKVCKLASATLFSFLIDCGHFIGFGNDPEQVVYMSKSSYKHIPSMFRN